MNIKIFTKARIISLIVGFILIIGFASLTDYMNNTTIDLVGNLQYGIYFIFVIFIFQIISDYSQKHKKEEDLKE